MYSDEIIKESAENAFKMFQSFMWDTQNPMTFEDAFDAIEWYFTDEIETGMSFGPEEEASLQAYGIWEKIRAQLKTRCYNEYVSIEKEKKVRQMRQIIVDNLILPEIRKAGLPYCFEYQEHRLKISLRVDTQKEFTFYIHYSDFQEEKVIEKIPELLNIIPLLKTFGPRISLVRTSIPYGRWLLSL